MASRQLLKVIPYAVHYLISFRYFIQASASISENAGRQSEQLLEGIFGYNQATMRYGEIFLLQQKRSQKLNGRANAEVEGCVKDARAPYEKRAGDLQVFPEISQQCLLKEDFMNLLVEKIRT